MNQELIEAYRQIDKLNNELRRCIQTLKIYRILDMPEQSFAYRTLDSLGEINKQEEESND